MRPGQTALLIGASGSIGTALLQLGRLAGLKLYGLASPSKHAALADYGATPVDYRTEDFVSVIRQIEPGGLDAVFDGMGGGYLPRGFGLLKRGDVCSRGEATFHSSVRIDLRKKRSPVIRQQPLRRRIRKGVILSSFRLFPLTWMATRNGDSAPISSD